MRKQFYHAYNKYKFPSVSVRFPIELNLPDSNFNVFGVDAQEQMRVALEQFVGEPNNEQTRERMKATINLSSFGINIEDLNL